METNLSPDFLELEICHENRVMGPWRERTVPNGEKCPPVNFTSWVAY